MFNHDRVAKLLIRHGIQINAKTSSGESALLFAENFEIFQILVEEGIDLNAVNSSGDTATDIALANPYEGQDRIQYFVNTGFFLSEHNLSDNRVITALSKNKQDREAAHEAMRAIKFEENA